MPFFSRQENAQNAQSVSAISGNMNRKRAEGALHIPFAHFRGGLKLPLRCSRRFRGLCVPALPGIPLADGLRSGIAGPTSRVTGRRSVADRRPLLALSEAEGHSTCSLRQTTSSSGLWSPVFRWTPSGRRPDLQPLGFWSPVTDRGSRVTSHQLQLSPLQCTLTENALVSPVDATLTKSLDLNCRGMTFLQKNAGGVPPLPPVDAVGITVLYHRVRFEETTQPAQQKNGPSVPSTPLSSARRSGLRAGNASRADGPFCPKQ